MDFVAASDDGIQLTIMSKLGEVSPELVERRGIALAIPLAGGGFAQERHGQLSGGEQVGSQTSENLPADAFFFS